MCNCGPPSGCGPHTAYTRLFSPKYSWFRPDAIHIQILEAGPKTAEIPEYIVPGRFFKGLSRPSEAFTFHAGKPSEALASRSAIVPAGRCVGGGSSVNCKPIRRI